MSIGARSQSARTYLEKHLTSFENASKDELIKHGLRALRECLPADTDLNTKNVSLGILGDGMDFTIYDDEEMMPFVSFPWWWGSW
ncbi:PSMA1 [Cordylochernes scorpioides]|uniref:PSMA1 n=1 Tax=Cordylochernes scorpioides TaxID=51811 RepID=A0ABY6L5R3_9ARAC|nr:PSMA1 [Cordylochernes scorpioides]